MVLIIVVVIMQDNGIQIRILVHHLIIGVQNQLAGRLRICNDLLKFPLQRQEHVVIHLAVIIFPLQVSQQMRIILRSEEHTSELQSH